MTGHRSNRPPAWPARLARDQRGGITLLGTTAIGLGLGCLAFAVDLGAMHLESRRLQGIADAAALSAAGNLASADAAADAAIRADGEDATLGRVVTTGEYRADLSIDHRARFVAGSGTVNAAQVTVDCKMRLIFGLAAFGRQEVSIRRTAVARRADMAAFSLGSRLASLDGSIANQLLSGLTGSSISLSVMDYNALLDADVELFGFMQALQTELGLETASFDTALQTELSGPKALSALARALDKQGKGSVAITVRTIAASLSAGKGVRLDRLISLGPLGAQDRAAPGQAIAVNSYDMLRGMLEIAAGDRQVKLNLGASIPGLASTTAWVSVGDRMASSPWLTVTDKGDPIIRTAQTRVYVEAKLATSGVLALLGAAQVRVPLFIELAEAEAKLASVSCNGGSRTVSLLVRPAIGHASIADIDTTKLNDHKTALTEANATIVSLPLLKIGGKARVDLTGPDWQALHFTESEIASHQVKTVSSNSLFGGVAASLASKLNLTVTFLGIGVSTAAIGALTGSIVGAAAPALDGLVNNLTGLLGIHLGQADVRINGVRCGQAALVG